MKKLFFYILFPLLLIAEVGFSQQRSDQNQKILCKGSSLDLIGPIATGVKWFKDGLLFSTRKNITVHEAGSYVVVAINEHGCESDAAIPLEIIVWDVPTQPVVTGTRSACLSTSIHLTATSTVSDNQEIFYEWYKKGETIPFASGKEISYLITKNEVLTVKATAKKGSCQSAVSDVNIESLTPFGTFSADRQVASFGQSIQFKSEVTNAATYEWDFGDGFKSSLANPLHYYNKSGSMNVVLKAYSAEGCLLNISKLGYIVISEENGTIIAPPVENEIVLDQNPFVFKVYPNPVIDHMYLDIYSKVPQKALIEYFTMDGRIIHKYEEQLSQGNNTISAKNITLFIANSNYIVRVTLNNRVETTQIFKAYK